MSKTQDAFHNWLAQQGPLDSVQFWHCWKAASELSAQRLAELEAEVARLSGELSLANRTGDHLGMRVRDLKADVASLRVDAERIRYLDSIAYSGVNAHARTTLWCLRGLYEKTNQSFIEAIDAAMLINAAELERGIDAARGVK